MSLNRALSKAYLEWKGMKSKPISSAVKAATSKAGSSISLNSSGKIIYKNSKEVEN